MNNVDGAHIYGQLARPGGAGARGFPRPPHSCSGRSPPYLSSARWVTDYAGPQGWLVLNVGATRRALRHGRPGVSTTRLPQLIKKLPLKSGGQSREQSYFWAEMYLGDYGRSSTSAEPAPTGYGKRSVV